MNKLMKALDDPTRRRILELLRAGDLNAGELAAQFSMTLPSISHHLGILADANLVTREKRGQFAYFSLNTSVFQELVEWIFALKGEKA